MAKEVGIGHAGEEREAVLNAPDVGDDGEIDVERYTLPDSAGIADPRFKAAWDEAAKSFPGGELTDETPADEAKEPA